MVSSPFDLWLHTMALALINVWFPETQTHMLEQTMCYEHVNTDIL